MGKTGYVVMRKNNDVRYKHEWDGVMYDTPALEAFTKKGKILLFDRKLSGTNVINLKVEIDEGQEDMFEEDTIAKEEGETIV